MDKFAIDLDKVLDDFEKSEDRAVQLDQNTSVHDDSLLKNSLDNVQNIDNKLFYISHNISETQPLSKERSEKLDLSEADFASALKPSTLLSIPGNSFQAQKSLQYANDKMSICVNNEKFSDLDKWTREFKNQLPESDLSKSVEESNKHFTNGYHVQNEEVLCISLQNSSNERNTSYKSSDIQIQLLPSYSTDHVKEFDNSRLTQNMNLQNLNNIEETSNCTPLNEKQACGGECDFNVSLESSIKSKLENCDVDEKSILSKDESVLEINVCDHNSTRSMQQDDCEENEDDTESLQQHHLEDNVQLLSEDGGSKELVQSLNLESISNVNEEKNNYTSESNRKSQQSEHDSSEIVSAVGFGDVELNEDIDVNEMNVYLSDILNDSSTLKEENSKNEITTEFQQDEITVTEEISFLKPVETDNNENNNNNNNNIEKSDVNFGKLEGTVDNEDISKNIVDEKLEILQVFTDNSSQCKIMLESTENFLPESKNLIIENSDDNKDIIYDTENKGARPKFMDYSVLNNYSEKTDLEERNLTITSELSVETVKSDTNSTLHKDNYDEDILALQNNIHNSFGGEKIFIPETESSCQTYDDNGNLTDQNHTDTDNSLDTQGIQSEPGRLARPTTLDLPVRVSVRQVPTELHDPAVEGVEGVAEVLDEKDGETNQSVNNELTEQQLSLSEAEQKLGKFKPYWIPDGNASSCMHCNVKFTMIKRRHHCRACGKVLCAQCCSQKTRLPHLDNKEARVCQHCFAILIRVQEWERLSNNNVSPSPSSGGSSPSLTSSIQSGSNSPGLITNQQDGVTWWPPNPNNPQEYCSTISPLQQAQPYLNCPPPTVLVPIGVLKRGDKPKGEPKQVMFSDGIRPGGDLTSQSETSDHMLPFRRQGRVQRRIEKSPTENNPQNVSTGVKNHKSSQLKHRSKRIVICDSEGPLPPILLPPEYIMETKPDAEKLINWLLDEQSRPVVFALTKNLSVSAKIVTLDCCVGKQCWCFSSNGLHTVGQDEVIVVLKRLSNENTVPRDIFHLFSTLYDNASKGITVGNLGHVLFPEGILGSREHSGFLFVQHTFQCLGKLIRPSPPFLLALLIQKWEVPWAKMFPIRLMLRLGAEFRYYPCPLISVRYRNPVYCEIGHTIMNVLADFRNYQFTIPLIPGVFIHMEEKKTTVSFPRNTYEKVMKVLSNSNDHVLALASNFSTEADSHLVCVQNEDGNYQTQAINIQNTPRRVTGSSFVVFSGALKTSTGLTAKSSIVEDGILVQIPSDTMSDLKNALRDMKDFTIGCGLSNSQQPEEVIYLQWTKDDKSFNIGVRSPIDNRSLEGVQSIRIHTGTDYAGDHHLIRWTEVFFLQMEESGSRQLEPTDPSRLAEAVAQACCQALTPHLQWLAEAELNKIGLRVTLDSDKVGYDIGAAGEPLPSMYMNALDSALIPIITCASTSNHDGPIILELIFHILLK